MKTSIVFVFLCLGVVSAFEFEQDTQLYEGSTCKTKYGAEGVCRMFRDCPFQIHMVKDFPSEYWPQMCTFSGTHPVVCCAEASLRPSERACRRLEEDIQYNRIAPHQEYVIPRVYGGGEARYGTHAHVVALGFLNKRGRYEWSCGGTLISDSYVLTSAHCVASPRGKAALVWTGVHDLKRLGLGNMYPVEETIVHPMYNPNSDYHNIALLKVKVDLNTDVIPACVSSQLEDPDRAAVLGWGAMDADDVTPLSTIQLVNLKTVPQKRCNQSYVGRTSAMPENLVQGIMKMQICAERLDGKVGACNVDSGGPLRIKRSAPSKRQNVYTVVGVASFGKQRNCGTMGLYTRVASYIDWIESIVWPEE